MQLDCICKLLEDAINWRYLWNMRSLRDEIREAGLRATASREAVLAALRKAEKPMSHQDVVDVVGEQSWDRATLYRNLIDLAEAGLLRRVSLGTTWHFEQANGDKHAHFVCTECGTVECAPEMQVVSKRGSPKSVKQGNVDVQLHGLCDNCD